MEIARYGRKFICLELRCECDKSIPIDWILAQAYKQKTPKFTFGAEIVIISDMLSDKGHIDLTKLTITGKIKYFEKHYKPRVINGIQFDFVEYKISGKKEYSSLMKFKFVDKK